MVAFQFCKPSAVSSFGDFGLMFPILRKGLFLGLALSLAIPGRAEAIVFNFDWAGQIAGFQVSGSFGYDETQSYTDGIVRTDDLDFLNISFFAPDGGLLEAYTDNHLDSGVNFNFDTGTREILQAGSYNEPDGLNLGAPNFDQESGNDPALASGFSFWSKPPRSSTPHLHVDDWASVSGIPAGFDPHEDVSFPTRTTQELVDTGRVDAAYLPPNGQTAVALNETGQFAQVTAVPEPVSVLGLLGFGSGLLVTRLKRRQEILG
ncbi:MAG: PEP-CTERM sorting domain-containing protein [Cyanobacteria bacterium P01_F01_bin.116]